MVQHLRACIEGDGKSSRASMRALLPKISWRGLQTRERGVTSRTWKTSSPSFLPTELQRTDTGSQWQYACIHLEALASDINRAYYACLHDSHISSGHISYRM